MTSDGAGWDLIQAAQAGNTAALGEFWTVYEPVVRRKVVVLLRDRLRRFDPVTVDDMVSETFCDIARLVARPGFVVRDSRPDVGGWLWGVARIVVLRSMPRLLAESSWDPQLLKYLFDAAVTPVGPPNESAGGGVVLSALQVLTPAQRECVRLRFVENMPLVVAAEVMGRDRGAVADLTRHALEALRVELTARKARCPDCGGNVRVGDAGGVVVLWVHKSGRRECVGSLEPVAGRVMEQDAA